MPPKRSTRAAAATTTTKSTTAQTRTTRADATTTHPAVGGASTTSTTTTTTTTKRAAAPSRKMKAPTSAGPQQLDGAADDDDGDADNNTETSNGGGDNNSGEDSDTLGISTRPARLFRRADRVSTTTAEDYVMTGALAEGDGAARKNNRNVRTRGRMRGGVTKQRTAAKDPEQAKALEALRKRREEAMGGGDRAAAPAAGATAGAAAAKQADAEREEEEDTERGRRQEVPGTASRVRRASSSHWNNTMPGSAVKAQGTPATERSVLALTKFKKRRRQGSLLRMMQQSDAEDTGGDDSMDDSAATLDYSLGDFEPDHEGTPLNLGRAGSMAAALPGSEPRTSSSRKRKLAERDEMMEISTVQVPRSSPPVMEDQVVADGEETSSEHLYSEVSEAQQMVVDTQPEPQEDEEVATSKAAMETAAPHRSTSPLSSIPAEPEPEEAPAKRPRRAAARTTKSTGRTARKASTVDPEDHAADPLSSSELESDTATETPVSMRTSRKKTNSRKPKVLSLSTATLQSLLPRRRKKFATRSAKTATVGTFEIPSSSEAEEEEVEVESDEDELQRPPAATKGRGRKKATARTSDSTVRSKKQPNITAAAVAAKDKPGKKRLSRTYGRRSSDKENQDGDASMYVRSGGESDGDDDGVVETREMREKTKSKELEAAARKFKEIDEWEMEFESVDMGGASASSPWR
ncbi:hypothetical protein DIS24_g1143 [Lasiodiplodia hormozganensis]|uniref:Uncharacterized protein n=1 Tax=Lasiodiplodia hormozganensis TaxID=869390 RepID=A0AA39Z3T9_9PEZI|nr:hypothetical protein DIS24_g1143 [Lasiodiplodia hormozganensis]